MVSRERGFLEGSSGNRKIWGGEGAIAPPSLDDTFSWEYFAQRFERGIKCEVVISDHRPIITGSGGGYQVRIRRICLSSSSRKKKESNK